MPSWSRRCMLALALAVGCGPLVGVGDESSTSTGHVDPSTTRADTGTTSTGTTSTTSAGSTTMTTTTVGTTVDDATASSSDDVTDSGCAFIPEGCQDGGGYSIECDVWAQNCPEGEKCTPWANDGGSYWNATRCVPVDPRAGEIGDPCTVEGSHVSGIDSCRLGAQCFFVDPETNTGVCTANCDGNEADPLCSDPSTVCDVEFEGTIHLCLPTCAPLSPSCPALTACVPASNGVSFVCAPYLQPSLSEHEPCASVWDCLPGKVCLDGDLDPECASERCCFDYCNLLLGAGCEGQDCTPWFDRATVPPGFENLGICTG